MFRINTPNKLTPPLGLSLTFHSLERDLFIIQSLHIHDNNELKWRHYIENQRLVQFFSLKEAIDYINTQNDMLLNKIYTIGLDSNDIGSLRLKISKAISCKTRLVEEEVLMLRIAKKNKESYIKPVKSELKVEHEAFREPLFEILSATPYIRVAAIRKFGAFLTKVGDNEWTHIGKSNQKNMTLCHRAKICEGFDLNPEEHWGKNKSIIRKMLLPRANQLLQLTSVKKLLADALEQGQKVLVWGNHVFWYEESTLQWEIKMVNDRYDSSSNKNTLWVEGTIISKNHGRLIVLPYIKSDGTKVSGHTKNAPHDTKAIKREPSDYVELPFNCIDGDLMYGLLGDMHYE